MGNSQKKIGKISVCLEEGEKQTLELFRSLEWPDQPGDENLFRIKKNGKWFSPTGKFSFFTKQAIWKLGLSFFDRVHGYEDCPPPPVIDFRRKVTVLYGACVDGLPLEKLSAWPITPFHQEIDGRWYMYVKSASRLMKVTAENIEQQPREQ